MAPSADSMAVPAGRLPGEMLPSRPLATLTTSSESFVDGQLSSLSGASYFSHSVTSVCPFSWLTISQLPATWNPLSTPSVPYSSLDSSTAIATNRLLLRPHAHTSVDFGAYSSDL